MSTDVFEPRASRAARATDYVISLTPQAVVRPFIRFIKVLW